MKAEDLNYEGCVLLMTSAIEVHKKDYIHAVNRLCIATKKMATPGITENQRKEYEKDRDNAQNQINRIEKYLTSPDFAALYGCINENLPANTIKEFQKIKAKGIQRFIKKNVVKGV